MTTTEIRYELFTEDALGFNLMESFVTRAEAETAVRKWRREPGYAGVFVACVTTTRVGPRQPQRLSAVS